MKRFIIVVVILIVFVVLVVAALGLLRGRARSTLLIDTLCEPPCWQAIEPGETYEWNAIGILERMPGVGSIMQWGDPEAGGVVGWQFSYPIGDSAGYIYSLNKRVVAISIMTIGSLDVEEALAKYGEPDSMWVRYRETESSRWLEVVLHYPAQGVFVRVEVEPLVDDENKTAYLEERSPIGRVIYYDQAQYDYLIDSRLLFRESRETILERLQPWAGLGMVSFERLARD